LEVGSCFPGWGGTELHLLNLSEQLVRRGHRVTITCRPGLFVEQEAQKRGLRTVPISVVKQQDWSNRRAIQDLIRAERFDVVHAHWRPDYLVTPFIARRSGVPVVLLSHHSPHRLKMKERILYPRFIANRMIALSESVRRMLVGQGFSPEFVTTIHHGTDTDAFRRTTLPPETVRGEWGVPAAARLVVGIVGRIAPEKGHLYLLEAVKSLAAEGTTLHLVIIGDGPQEAEVREAVASHGLSDRVTFAGFRSDVNNAVNALDVLVLASTWQEPCAAVVQQAMALCKPVIGTDAGGTPEMVADNETGLIVPPSDSRALADALRRVSAMSAAERAVMGAAGSARVDALFSQTVMVDKIEDLYYTELALRRGTAAPAPRTDSVGIPT
jgi:glycosyltransferase involved in cell wall biosynthesis